jgi:hypothetical protein
MLLLVLRLLPARDLARAGGVCRAWRRAAREPWLWVRQFAAVGYALPLHACVAAEGEGGAPPPRAEPGPPPGPSAGTAGGLRDVRATRALRAVEGGGEGFLSGLRGGFLDSPRPAPPPGPRPPAPPAAAAATAGGERSGPPSPSRRAAAAAATPGLDLRALFGRYRSLEANWGSGRYAESTLRCVGADPAPA